MSSPQSPVNNDLLSLGPVPHSSRSKKWKKKTTRDGISEGNDVHIDVTPVTNDNASIPLPQQPITDTQSSIDDASNALLPTIMYKEPNCMEKCCCGSLANMACGYPSGTIRATIAVIFSIIFACTCTFLVVYFAIEGKDNVAIAAAGLLSTVLSGITGYYFGTRSEPKSTDTDRITRRI